MHGELVITLSELLPEIALIMHGRVSSAQSEQRPEDKPRDGVSGEVGVNLELSKLIQFEAQLLYPMLEKCLDISVFPFCDSYPLTFTNCISSQEWKDLSGCRSRSSFDQNKLLSFSS